MNKQKWIILAMGLALIGGAGAALSGMKAHQKLGQPGIKATAVPGSPRMDIYLPQHVMNFTSEPVVINAGVLSGLPADTSIVQRRYMTSSNNGVLLNVVLMGTDRTSIHKPQFCLKGSGWDIDDAVSMEDTVHVDRPHPYELPVMKLLASRQAEVNGQTTTVRGVYVYWFVAENELTGSHQVRMWKTATHLLKTGELERWAYVTAFTICLPGEESKTYDFLKKFIAASVPEFQKTTGPNSEYQKVPQTAAK
jgi:hypothetical protein